MCIALSENLSRSEGAGTLRERCPWIRFNLSESRLICKITIAAASVEMNGKWGPKYIDNAELEYLKDDVWKSLNIVKTSDLNLKTLQFEPVCTTSLRLIKRHVDDFLGLSVFVIYGPQK